MADLKKIIVLLMGIAILLPTTLINLNEVFPSLQINEKRLKKERPVLDLVGAVEGRGEYFKEWEEYFNDNFAARDLLIRTKNQINYSAFKYSPELYFGADGYFYQGHVITYEQYQNELMTQKDIEALVDELKHVEQICTEKGINFKFFIPPDKSTTLQEMKFPVRRPQPNAYEVITQCFAEKLPGSYVDVLGALREADDTNPVFYKTDWHWNNYGAATAFGKVINEFIPAGEEDKRLKNRFDFSTVKFEGDQIPFLSILEPMAEDASVVANNTTDEVPGLEVQAPLSFHAINNGDAILEGAALFIGDSFTTAALDPAIGIKNCFEEVYWVHINDSKGILNHLPPNVKYIIFERIEAQLFAAKPIVEALDEG